MKRLILYIPVLIVFIILFDVGFQWFVKTLIFFYREHIVDTVFWYIGKLFLFFTVIGILSYILHLMLGGISNLLSKISPNKPFNRMCISIALAINCVVWLYGIWIESKHPYDLNVVILNLLLTAEFLNFTAAIFVGHTVSEEEAEIETPELASSN